MSVDRIASFCSTQVVCVSHSVLKKSIEDRLAPAKKQIILGKGTCNGVDTINHFNPSVIENSKVEALKTKYIILV